MKEGKQETREGRNKGVGWEMGGTWCQHWLVTDQPWVVIDWMILGFQAETFAPSNTELTNVHLLLSYPQPLILSLVYILFPIFLIVKEIHTS